MKTYLAVDDEEMGLKALQSAIMKADAEAEIKSFHNPKEALAYVKENDIYAAFLDIQMPGMSGTELGKKIKLVRPEAYIIFVTGFDSYMGDAFSLHANGYVLKPVTAKKISAELENIGKLHAAAKKNIASEGKKVRFQCFGNFEIFVDGKLISFKYEKTKEVLAYLVSRRGAFCSNEEVILNVWDDDGNHDSYFRGLKKDMVDTLRNLGADDIIDSQKGKNAVVIENVACDYYDFLAGNPAAINLYHGEFMNQYSWGEFVNGELDIARY